MNQMPLGLLFNLAAPYTHMHTYTLVPAEINEWNESATTAPTVPTYSTAPCWCLCLFSSTSFFFPTSKCINNELIQKNKVVAVKFDHNFKKMCLAKDLKAAEQMLALELSLTWKKRFHHIVQVSGKCNTRIAALMTGEGVFMSTRGLVFVVVLAQAVWWCSW